MSAIKRYTFLISCYNSGKYISKMLNSLLEQTILLFDVVICNDGSTDNTMDILLKFKGCFKEKGINITIINKDNGGVSSAINAMLPLVKTDYFISCDSDDWYEKNFIEKVEEHINNYGQFSIGITPVCICKDGEIIQKRELCDADLDKNLYNRYIDGNDVPCYTGINIINFADFRRYNGGSTTIFDSRYGQNWQLLLPLLKKVKPRLIKETCYYYLIRDDSITHLPKNFNDVYNLINGYSEILEHVLTQLGDLDKNHEKQSFYNTQSCNLSFANRNKEYFLKHYKNANKNVKLLAKRFLVIFW